MVLYEAITRGLRCLRPGSTSQKCNKTGISFQMRSSSKIAARLEKTGNSDDPELLADVADDSGGALKVGAFVRCSNDGAQACLPFRDSGKADGHGENALGKKLARQFGGFCGIADHDWSDWGFALASVEAELF